MLLLPAVCSLAIFLPPPSLPGPRAFPHGIFALWLAATATHLYCLGYVYDFPLRSELVTPAIWVLAWMIRHQLAQFISLGPRAERALLIPPLLASILAAAPADLVVFTCVSGANAAIFATLWWRDRGNRMAFHLALISIFALFAAMPGNFAVMPSAALWFRSVASAILGYALLCAGLSRDFRAGLFGGMVAATAALVLLREDTNAVHWAIEIGIGFLLLHSYRWAETGQRGARLLRVFAALAWLFHAVIWMRYGGEAWMSCAIAAPILAAALVVWLWVGAWTARILPAAASLVILSGPANSSAGTLHQIPLGVVAVLASFLFLGLGTLAALSRRPCDKTAS